jgi:hypothetical protein
MYICDKEKLEFPPFAHHVIFVTEFVFLGKNLHFYEVRENNFAYGGISK